MADTEPTAPDSPAVVDLEALSRVEAELTDVEVALQRLDEGTYGTCEVCSAPLADDVLEAEPTARRCQAHAA
jgi:RNA polymerase-binding transcription factor DksA